MRRIRKNFDVDYRVKSVVLIRDTGFAPKFDVICLRRARTLWPPPRETVVKSLNDMP